MKTATTIKKGAASRFRAGTGVQRLHDRLVDLAYASQPNAQLPSYQELCDSFGTSPSSLRQALDELERRNIIYRKRGHGIYVSPRLRERCVRIFFNSNLISRTGLSPFWAVLSGLILSEAQQRAVTNEAVYKFDLVPASHFHDPAVTDELMQLYQEGQIHGVVAIGMGESPTIRDVDSSIPVVTYADYGHWQVGADIEHAAGLGLEALVELGCRRVALWSHMYEDIVGKPGDSYLDALGGVLAAHGLTFYPELIHGPREFLGSDPDVNELTYPEQGYLMALKIFSNGGVKPDGLFLLDDMFAQGVLTAFRELGIKPAEDVHLVSMCNTDSPILYGYESVLTLVEHNPAELVTAMFDALDILMSGRTPGMDVMRVKARLIRPADRHRREDVLKRFKMS
jgi:DNA-binding LacI/PurR family transcriptional regulator